MSDGVALRRGQRAAGRKRASRAGSGSSESSQARERSHVQRREKGDSPDDSAEGQGHLELLNRRGIDGGVVGGFAQAQGGPAIVEENGKAGDASVGFGRARVG